MHIPNSVATILIVDRLWDMYRCLVTGATWIATGSPDSRGAKGCTVLYKYVAPDASEYKLYFGGQVGGFEPYVLDHLFSHQNGVI